MSTRPTVLGYLINALGDRGAAEDVHQQVFLEVWQRAPGYDPERSSILTWIMTIARSRAVDELRALTRETREIWDQKADFWDERMGDGNAFQRVLIGQGFELEWPEHIRTTEARMQGNPVD